MRFLILALFVATVASASRISVGNPELDSAWQRFKVTYNKKYDHQEEAVRRLVWENNMAHIQKHNQEAAQGKHKFTMGENKFADMTNEEFRKTMTSYRPRVRGEAVKFGDDGQDLPPTIDWSERNLVTPVLDGRDCDAAWIYSVVGAVEGQYARSSGKLVILSSQQVLDCNTEGDYGGGCYGDQTKDTYDYILNSGGLESTDDYPNDEYADECKFDSRKIVATISGYANIESGSEAELQRSTAAIGPISVVVDATGSSFQYYSSGVYDDEECDNEQVNHGLLVVGYGSDYGVDYWLAKNSWGSDWGEEGYIKIIRNANNRCGIATEASYPIVY